MWSKVKRYIDKYKLLKPSNLYLIALSGGADSVALLLLLKSVGFNVHAAHCNFHLRGNESDRDEAFCMELCQQLGVELHRAHFDTREYAELHKVSIEMAARELRYKWFEQLCRDIGAEGVCVAHHRDDSVETVLLNLVRGTGLRGLIGIQPRSELMMACGQTPQEQTKLVVLRPLLCVSRAEIEAFLEEKGQKHVTDSTNLETDVQRNVIRLEVLPLLRKLNPAVAENIQRTAENLAEAQQVLNAVISSINGNNILNLSDLEKYGSSEYLVFEWLKKNGFNGDQVRQILDTETGKIVSSAMGYDVLKDRGRLIIEPALKSFKPMRIPEEGTYIFGSSNAEFLGTTENKTLRVRKKPVYVSKERNIATLDAAIVQFPLTVRRVEEGDWMQPYGMKGRKLLSDMMTDLKMTLFEKRRQLVIVDAQGLILWAVGLRIADFVAVSKTTNNVLEISVND